MFVVTEHIQTIEQGNALHHEVSFSIWCAACSYENRDMNRVNRMYLKSFDNKELVFSCETITVEIEWSVFQRSSFVDVSREITVELLLVTCRCILWTGLTYRAGQVLAELSSALPGTDEMFFLPSLTTS